jgi:hypothetical protein
LEFSFDGLLDVRVLFIPDKRVKTIPLRKSLDGTLLMLESSLDQLTRTPQIQCPVPSVSHDVDKAAFGEIHASIVLDSRLRGKNEV